METLDNLSKFAKLLATLNKEGLDTELIQIGVSQLAKVSDDEQTQIDEALAQIKEKLLKYRAELEDPKSLTNTSASSSKRIVRGYVDGCYDLMHAGHYNSLMQASKLGDVLVAGVNGDSEIEKVKGPPIFKGDERCDIVRACKWVDEVAPDTEYTPTEELLDRLNCDFYAHGDDIAINENGIDNASYLKKVGRFKMFKRLRGVSSTDLASKLIKIHDKNLARQSSKLQEESKMDPHPSSEKITLPPMLGSYNSNPDFLASARRIAQFANTRDPSESDKIVYVDGSFDIFRPAHVEQLREAKRLGDYVIVGIHDDECIRQYLGEDHPLNTLHERVLNVLACKYVDDVIIGAPFKITNRLLRDLSVGIVVKSLEYTQGIIIKEAEALNPYEVPDKIGMATEVEIESQLTLQIIAERVAMNRDAIATKVKNSFEKMKLMAIH